MNVKQLRAVLRKLPGDMKVLVPAGMDWGFLVKTKVRGYKVNGRHIVPEGTRDLALFLAPYDSED